MLSSDHCSAVHLEITWQVGVYGWGCSDSLCFPHGICTFGAALTKARNNADLKTGSSAARKPSSLPRKSKANRWTTLSRGASSGLSPCRRSGRKRWITLSSETSKPSSWASSAEPLVFSERESKDSLAEKGRAMIQLYVESTNGTKAVAVVSVAGKASTVRFSIK